MSCGRTVSHPKGFRACCMPRCWIKKKKSKGLLGSNFRFDNLNARRPPFRRTEPWVVVDHDVDVGACVLRRPRYAVRVGVRFVSRAFHILDNTRAEDFLVLGFRAFWVRSGQASRKERKVRQGEGAQTDPRQTRSLDLHRSATVRLCDGGELKVGRSRQRLRRRRNPSSAGGR